MEIGDHRWSNVFVSQIIIAEHPLDILQARKVGEISSRVHYRDDINDEV